MIEHLDGPAQLRLIRFRLLQYSGRNMSKDTLDQAFIGCLGIFGKTPCCIDCIE